MAWELIGPAQVCSKYKLGARRPTLSGSSRPSARVGEEPVIMKAMASVYQSHQLSVSAALFARRKMA